MKEYQSSFTEVATMSKHFNNNFDPFARAVPVDNAGAVSDRPDTSDEDNEAIKPYVPQEASTDDGYETMLKILNKKEPKASPTTEDVESPLTTVVHNRQAGEEDTAKPTTGVLNNVEPAKTEAEKEKTEFTKDEILPLLDSLLMKGIIRETFSIRGATVVFRTQFFWEDQMAMKLTEEHLTPGSLRDTGALVNSLYVLSMNIEQFGGNHFKPINRGTPGELRKSMEERAEFLQTLPSVLINYLWERRAAFFKKVEYISKNFEELIKDF